MTVTETVLILPPVSGDVLAAYESLQRLLGGAAAYQRVRVRAATQFMDDHGDLDGWMARPLEDRLADVSAEAGGWPFITFALVSTRLQADLELLLTKNFGHSMRRWIVGLYPTETRLMLEAATRIGISEHQAMQFIAEGLGVIISLLGKAPGELTSADLDDCVAEIKSSTIGTPAIRRRRSATMFGLRKLLFEAHLVDCPPEQRRVGGPQTRAQRLAVIAAPAVRDTLIRYLDARATVLRPKSISKMTSALAVFGEFLTEHDPKVTSVDLLRREHIEAFLSWTATREARGNHAGRPVGPFVAAHAATSLRGFLEDIAAWGWPEAPARQLMFSNDIPRQPTYLPRALAPDIDTALMAAVGELDDLFARVALTILRGTGLRIGELLDLELDAIVDYGPAGSWLRVPIGKLHTERVVPLDSDALDAFDEWFAHRQQQRARPHPRTNKPADFVFVENGRHLSATRVQRGLRDAVRHAGITGPDGQPLKIVAHQLRHTYATSLVNAGMSMQALMQLLGHSSPEMTIRYARLASPTLRAAYDQAIGKLRRRIPVAPVIGGHAVPDDVDWIHSEMIKTRVAHGHCSRDLTAEACAYANICETCSNFTTTIEFEPAVSAQLADVRHLRDDAEQRGWGSETARHQRVIDSLEQHLHRLQNSRPSTESS